MADNFEGFASWREQQKESRYPFADFSSVESVEGLIIPNEVLIDASVAFANSDSYVELISVSKTDNLLTFTFRNLIETETAAGVFDLSAPSDTIYLYDTFNRRLGLLIVDIGATLTFGIGLATNLTFKSGAARLCPRCVHTYAGAGVTSLRIRDSSTALSGNALLIGEQGILLRHITEEVTSYTDPSSSHPILVTHTVNYIRVDVVGDPLAAAANCADSTNIPVTFPTSINGVTPNEYGNINLAIDRGTLGSALRIIPNAKNSELIIKLAGVGI